MTSRDFCFWLQGYMEISGCNQLHPHQVAMIQKHLSLVFKHEIDPSMGDEKHQAELNAMHKHTPTVDYATYWASKYPKPAEATEEWKVGMHGWYNPKEGTPRC